MSKSKIAKENKKHKAIEKQKEEKTKTKRKEKKENSLEEKSKELIFQQDFNVFSKYFFQINKKLILYKRTFWNLFLSQIFFKFFYSR